MKLKSKAALLFLSALMVLSTAACSNEGDAEKAGKKIDKAFSTVKDKINDATK